MEGPVSAPSRAWQTAGLTLLAISASVFLGWLTVLTTPSTPGNDLAVYQNASADLYSTGSPYTGNLGAPEEAQYRYPPLLAIVMPVLDPIWFGLILLGVAIPFYLGWRQDGWRGTLWPLAVLGTNVHAIGGSGNIQPLANGMWAAVPFYRTAGPIILAALTWVKVWPALSLLWYIGRRDWRSLVIYAAAMVVLAIPQLPWLGEWVTYWLSPAAHFTARGFAISVLFGDAVWIIASALAVTAALVFAPRPWGWRLGIIAHFIVNPRWFIPSLSSLSAMVYRGSERDRD